MVTGQAGSENQMRAGEGKRFMFLHVFFPMWISFQREFTVPTVQAALLVQWKVQKQTAMAPKPPKWPKYDDRTAGLG